MSYAYVFSIGPGVPGVPGVAGAQLDTMLDVSGVLGRTVEAYDAEKALMDAAGFPDKMPSSRQVAAAIRHIQIRVRMHGGEGPLLIKSEDPLDRDVLQRILDMHVKDGTISGLVKATKFRI